MAALYVTLGAYFLAAIQVLDLHRGGGGPCHLRHQPHADRDRAPVTLSRRWVIPAALVSALTACLIIIALLKAGGPAGGPGAGPGPGLPAGAAPASPGGADSAAVLGRHLLGDYVLPFELVSVLLLSALIAAIAIVGKDREDER